VTLVGQEMSNHKLLYETQGFVHVPGAVSPEMLTRLRAAFDGAVDRHAIRSKIASSTQAKAPQYFDIPHVLDEDDVFVDLVDIPSVFPILLEIIGDDIQLHQTQARMFPPGPTFTAPWHSDIHYVNGIDQSHSLNFLVKVHFYPEDLAPNQGCLAFIPGSHRYPPKQPRPDVDYKEESPAMKKIVPKAGDAIMFNAHVLHMALDNLSPHVRKSLIYVYSHFWMKNYPTAIPKDLKRLATTPQRKQLFGILSPEAQGSYFSQTLKLPSIRTEAQEVLSAGRRLLLRTKEVYFGKQ
jgi:phytanoyl-CoA hydroxylase